jgi:A/G-specific adenine glycosylase
VLVSEVMLQQTPVARVEPVYRQWVQRWPHPADLAAAPAGDSVRAWGRLGYPRRALRLHEAAGVIAREHAGRVPDDLTALRALPGVGDYTACAVAAFAYGAAVPVLDTNVRRVLARLARGQALPPAHTTRAERHAAVALLPPAEAPTWSVGLMELGALVCTAAAPRCEACPVNSQCAWLQAGRPDNGAVRRPQPFTGTDRQVRGRLLGAVREGDGPVPAASLRVLWPDAEQRARALASLLADGLLGGDDTEGYRLPG